MNNSKYFISILLLGRNMSEEKYDMDSRIFEETDFYKIERIYLRDKEDFGLSSIKTNLDIIEFGNAFLTSTIDSLIFTNGKKNEVLFVIDSFSKIDYESFQSLVKSLDYDSQVECAIPRGNNNGIATYPRLSDLCEEKCISNYKKIKKYLNTQIFTRIAYSHCFLLKLDFLRELHNIYDSYNDDKLNLTKKFLNLSQDNVSYLNDKYEFLKYEISLLLSDNKDNKGHILNFTDNDFKNYCFSDEMYLMCNLDVRNSQVLPFVHFCTNGRNECRWITEEKFSDRLAMAIILEYVYQIINKYGKIALIDNQAFVYTDNVSITNDESLLLEEFQFEDFSNWKDILLQQLRDPNYVSDSIYSGFIPNNDKYKITLDFSNFPCSYNGTTQVGMNFLDSVYDVYKNDYELDVIISEDSWNFHKIGEKYPLVTKYQKNGHNYSLIFMKFGQPFDPLDLINMFSIAPITTCFIYDCIAVDCNYIYLRDWIWDFAIKHSSIVGTISEFSKKIIQNRFEVSDERLKIYHLPNSLEDITIGEQNQSKYGKYILVIGNYFAHKFVPETVNVLAKKFSSLNIVSMAKIEKIHDNVIIVPSGNLSEDEINNIFNNALAIIYPSVYEGYGLPIIESASRNKKTFIRDNELNNEVSELLSDNLNQFVRKFIDTEDLVNQIELFLSSENRNENMNTYSSNELNYSWSTCSNSYINDCIKISKENDFQNLKKNINERSRFLTVINGDATGIFKKCKCNSKQLALLRIVTSDCSFFSFKKNTYSKLIFSDNKDFEIIFDHPVNVLDIRVEPIDKELTCLNFDKIELIDCLNNKQDVLKVSGNSNETEVRYNENGVINKIKLVKSIKKVICAKIRLLSVV